MPRLKITSMHQFAQVLLDLLSENVKSGFSTDGWNLRPPAVNTGATPT